jgi:hypothetical protein
MGLDVEPDPEAWVRVTALPVEDAQTLVSQRARKIVEALHQAGIEARTEPYVIPDSGARFYRLQPPGEASDRVRATILVRVRDHDAAIELLRRREQRGRELDLEMDPISDEDLAQQALEAAPTSQREASTDQ